MLKTKQKVKVKSVKEIKRSLEEDEFCEKKVGFLPEMGKYSNKILTVLAVYPLEGCRKDIKIFTVRENFFTWHPSWVEPLNKRPRRKK
jgi:hypothetical protein